MVEFRELMMHEVPQMTAFALEFYDEGFVPGQLIPEIFEGNWMDWIERDVGFVVTAWDDNLLLGGAGGLIAPDANDGVLVANEIFWFVRLEHRCGSVGLRILKEFEVAAVQRGAKRVLMIHLANDVGARLAKVFDRWGYRSVETHYIKEIQ